MMNFDRPIGVALLVGGAIILAGAIWLALAGSQP
jgi:hypothetical protein